MNEAGATPLKVVTDVHTPLGLLWVGDTLYVSEATGVVALRGFDGTTFATRTTVLTVPDGTGEVNGIAQGSDGRLYVGHLRPVRPLHPDRAVVGVGHLLPARRFRRAGRRRRHPRRRSG